MALDYQEVFTLLEEYKNKAINEQKNEYEKTRHKHFGDLFNIKEEDPIFGSVKLDGSAPEVIELARTSLKRLANCNANDHKTKITKLGKQIVKRSTPEIKNLFSKLRNDEEALLTFLQWLFKTEAQILQIDEGRSDDRFGSGKNKHHNIPADQPTRNSSFIEEQKKNYIPLEDIVDDYLFSPLECNYKREAMEDHQSQCNKMRKAVSILIDYLYANNSKATSGDITIEAVLKIFDIIPKVPKKQGGVNTSYSYYDYYLKFKDTDYTKRGVSSIETDLMNYNRFVKYLEDKGYINAEELKQAQKHYKNVKRRLIDGVRDGDIEGASDTEALKPEMLKCFLILIIIRINNLLMFF